MKNKKSHVPGDLSAELIMYGPKILATYWMTGLVIVDHYLRSIFTTSSPVTLYYPYTILYHIIRGSVELQLILTL
jgi:hypothetical protein